MGNTPTVEGHRPEAIAENNCQHAGSITSSIVDAEAMGDNGDDGMEGVGVAPTVTPSPENLRRKSTRTPFDNRTGKREKQKDSDSVSGGRRQLFINRKNDKKPTTNEFQDHGDDQMDSESISSQHRRPKRLFASRRPPNTSYRDFDMDSLALCSLPATMEATQQQQQQQRQIRKTKHVQGRPRSKLVPPKIRPCTADESSMVDEFSFPSKPRRGRPRKTTVVDQVLEDTNEAVLTVTKSDDTDELSFKPRSKGRPRKKIVDPTTNEKNRCNNSSSSTTTNGGSGSDGGIRSDLLSLFAPPSTKSRTKPRTAEEILQQTNMDFEHRQKQRERAKRRTKLRAAARHRGQKKGVYVGSGNVGNHDDRDDGIVSTTSVPRVRLSRTCKAKKVYTEKDDNDVDWGQGMVMDDDDGDHEKQDDEHQITEKEKEEDKGESTYEIPSKRQRRGSFPKLDRDRGTLVHPGVPARQLDDDLKNGEAVFLGAGAAPAVTSVGIVSPLKRGRQRAFSATSSILERLVETEGTKEQPQEKYLSNKKRGRPKKNPVLSSTASAASSIPSAATSVLAPARSTITKKKRGRPRKKPLAETATEVASALPPLAAQLSAAPTTPSKELQRAELAQTAEPTRIKNRGSPLKQSRDSGLPRNKARPRRSSKKNVHEASRTSAKVTPSSQKRQQSREAFFRHHPQFSVDSASLNSATGRQKHESNQPPNLGRGEQREVEGGDRSVSNQQSPVVHIAGSTKRRPSSSSSSDSLQPEHKSSSSRKKRVRFDSATTTFSVKIKIRTNLDARNRDSDSGHRPRPHPLSESAVQAIANQVTQACLTQTAGGAIVTSPQSRSRSNNSTTQIVADSNVNVDVEEQSDASASSGASSSSRDTNHRHNALRHSLADDKERHDRVREVLRKRKRSSGRKALTSTDGGDARSVTSELTSDWNAEAAFRHRGQGEGSSFAYQTDDDNDAFGDIVHNDDYDDCDRELLRDAVGNVSVQDNGEPRSPSLSRRQRLWNCSDSLAGSFADWSRQPEGATSKALALTSSPRASSTEVPRQVSVLSKSKLAASLKRNQECLTAMVSSPRKYGQENAAVAKKRVRDKEDDRKAAAVPVTPRGIKNVKKRTSHSSPFSPNYRCGRCSGCRLTIDCQTCDNCLERLRQLLPLPRGKAESSGCLQRRCQRARRIGHMDSLMCQLVPSTSSSQAASEDKKGEEREDEPSAEDNDEAEADQVVEEEAEDSLQRPHGRERVAAGGASSSHKPSSSTWDEDNNNDDWSVDYSYLSEPEYRKNWGRQQGQMAVAHLRHARSRSSSSLPVAAFRGGGAAASLSSISASIIPASSLRSGLASGGTGVAVGGGATGFLQNAAMSLPAASTTSTGKRGRGRPSSRGTGKSKKNQKNPLHCMALPIAGVAPRTLNTTTHRDTSAMNDTSSVASWQENRECLRALMQYDEADQDWV